jgi:ABC-type thiamine transport system ATPase subunit
MGDSLGSLGRLIELASGFRSPRRGRVLYAGAPVRESPSTRRSIVSVLPDEELPDASDVSTSVETVLTLKQSKSDALKLLRTWGLDAFARSSLARLDWQERRAVQLALCLGETEPGVTLLHDPLALSPLVPRDRVIARCVELARQRSVVITTDSLSDALALGGNAYLLERGRLSSYAGLAVEGLRVRAREAHRLADSLRADAQLRVHYDATHSELELLVTGESLSLVAERVARCAIERDITLEALSPATLALPLLLAARAARFASPNASGWRSWLGRKSA